LVVVLEGRRANMESREKVGKEAKEGKAVNGVFSKFEITGNLN